MPHPKGWDLPPPEFHQEFETLSLDLLRAKRRPLTEPSLFGRNGQPQQGVDFTLELPDGHHGFQCKRVQTLTFAEFECEATKTAGFPYPLRTFTLLTTAPVDNTVQAAVATLSQRRQKQGLGPVAVLYWSTLRDWLAEFPDVLRAHYPELAPSLLHLLQGSARRLSEDFPGSHLEFRGRPDAVEIVVHPGPSGIPISMTLIGREPEQRFQEAIRAGTSATFAQSEFALILPEALTGALHLGTRVDRSLTLQPTASRAKAHVRVVAHPVRRHHSLEIFHRRARQGSDGIPAVMTVERNSGARQRAVVDATPVPLKFIIEQEEGGSNNGYDLQFELSGDGALVDGLLVAESVLETLVGGGYCGIFGPDFALSWSTSRQSEDSERFARLTLLRTLVELSDCSGWELRLSATSMWSEISEAADLLSLFQGEWRQLGEVGTLQLQLRTSDHLAGIRSVVESAVGPLTVTFQRPARNVVFLGETRELPAVEVRVSGIVLSPDVHDKLIMADTPPVLIEFSGKVEERLLDRRAE